MAIPSASGFSVGSTDPIDDRLVLTKAQMKAANDNVYPEVYLATCSDDGKVYVYNKANEIDAETGKFREFKSGATIDFETELKNYSQDNLLGNTGLPPSDIAIKNSMGAANGIATLDNTGKLQPSQLPTTAREIVDYKDASVDHILPDEADYGSGNEIIITVGGYIIRSTAFTLDAGKELTNLEVYQANLLIQNGYVFTLYQEGVEVGTVSSFAIDGVTLLNGNIIPIPNEKELSATSEPSVIQMPVKEGDSFLLIDGHWILLSSKSKVESVNGKTGAVNVKELPVPESKDKLLMSTENEETSELEWQQVDKTEIVEIDDEMSETSENPVQNKVVNKAIIDNVFPKVENPSTYFSSNTERTGCFIYTGEDEEWVYNNMGSSSTQSKQSTVNLIKNNLYCISERKTIGTSSGSQLHCYSVLNMSSSSDSLKTMYDYGTIKDKYNFKNCASVVDLYNSIGGCLISVQNISDIFPETNGVIILAYANSYKATIYSTPVYTINMWFISTTGKMYICNDNSSTVSWNDSPYYIKPTEGISKTDLASDIQTSLGKADTSLQSETSLSKGTTSGSGNAVTDISVSGHKITLTKGTTFLTSHQDISGKVDKVSGKGLSTNDFTNTDKASITYYGTCSTSRATNAKVVDCANFALAIGVKIVVKFTDTAGSAPTSGNITLNVNSTGAKNVYQKDNTQMTYANSAEFRANKYCEFAYDGTNFIWLNYNSNTTYTTITQSEITAGTSTSTRVVTPKLLADNYLNKAGGTMTGALNAQKGLRVATSTPSTLADGDIWIS